MGSRSRFLGSSSIIIVPLIISKLYLSYGSAFEAEVVGKVFALNGTHITYNLHICINTIDYLYTFR